MLVNVFPLLLQMKDIQLAMKFENTLITFEILYPLLLCVLILKDKVAGQPDFSFRKYFLTLLSEYSPLKFYGH